MSRIDSWLEFRGAVLGVPAMLEAALRDPHGREAAVRVARAVRQLYVDAVSELGPEEADDVVGATMRRVRDRVIDIFGAAAWVEASPSASAQ